MSSHWRLPLYWRVCLINGAVLVVAAVALALAPVTVSTRVLASEALVLAAGLAAILLVNALLLRSTLRPLDRLARLMQRVDDLGTPGQRVTETGNGPVAGLVESFNGMLERLEAERRGSTAQALAAQEAERHRIARELHDEVGQGLTALLLGLKRVADRAPDDLRPDVAALQEHARASLDEVREVARRLRPGVLEDLGLHSALAALATDLTTSSGIHVQRGIAGSVPRLSPDAELVVYRVAQEALTNVARHSGADTVHLSLTRQGDSVALLVADNGRGTDGRAAGAGIRGMEERATLVGGRLTIRPAVTGGTEVRLVVPAEDAG